MRITCKAINAAVLAALIGIHGVRHSHIGTGDSVDDRFRKNWNILRFVRIRFLPIEATKFQKIVPGLVNVFEKFIGYVLLGTTAFDYIFRAQKMDLFQRYGLFPFVGKAVC